MFSLRLVTVLGILATAAVASSRVSAGSQAAPRNDDKTANPAAAAQPRADDSWLTRQNALNERTRRGGVDLVFIGDSITQGWEGQGKGIWATFYAHRNAENLGINGDHTEHVLWRLDHGNIDGIAPKAAVVLIGTNNTGRGETTEQIAAGVKAITDKLGEKLPKTQVLLLAIFPRGEQPDPQRDEITAINELLAKLADGKRVHYLDIGPRLMNVDGTIDREIMPDFLHLSAKGYGIWADAIEADLKKVLGEN